MQQLLPYSIPTANETTCEETVCSLSFGDSEPNAGGAACALLGCFLCKSSTAGGSEPGLAGGLGAGSVPVPVRKPAPWGACQPFKAQISSPTYRGSHQVHSRPRYLIFPVSSLKAFYLILSISHIRELVL